MAQLIAQIEKLRGRSLREIRVRGVQELSKLNERLLGSRVFEPVSDRMPFEIDKGSGAPSPETAALALLERVRKAPLAFFPSHAQRSEVASTIKQRFEKERNALLHSAEKAICGKFDLLGFSDLSFGDPIDWRFDPTTGKRSPLVHWSKINYLDPSIAGDKKVTWELNRHGQFVTFGQAYWLTGDERFAEAFVKQASDWMDANPPKQGINWTSSLELSFRLISWIWALHLFADSDRLAPKFVARFLKYLAAQGRHIESYFSHYFSPNTHLTGEALGLFYLGTALPEIQRANRWREIALEILIEQAPKHIRVDGTYFEQSSYYHRYTVDFYLHLTLLARASKIDLPGEVGERLNLALDHLMYIARPDCATTIYGDDDGGRLLKLNNRAANDFRDTLAIGAEMFERGDWKFVAGETPIETLWLLGLDGLENYDRLKAVEPVDESRAFSEGGYFVMRDGWSHRSSYTLIDGGPHGSLNCGHAHSDSLSFEYVADGQPWIVDPGTFTYTGQAELRDWFRSTAAHNTVVVDGLSQSEPSGPFAWRSKAKTTTTPFIACKGFDYFEGSHDGYQRIGDPVTHTRSILHLKSDESSQLPSYLIVNDGLAGIDDHHYSLRFHLAEKYLVSATGNTVTAKKNDRQLSIQAFGVSTMQSRVENGWISACYGRREEAPVVCFDATAKGPQRFITFIFPPKPDANGALWPPCINEGPYDAQERVATKSRSHRVFFVDVRDTRDVIFIAEKNGVHRHAEMSTDGTMFFARFVDYRFTRGCLIGGKTFEIADSLCFKSTSAVEGCGVEINESNVNIELRGCSEFEIGFKRNVTSILVNDSSFEFAAGISNARFALKNSIWHVVRKD